MQGVVAVNPHRCRVWQLHDRLEDHITEETCREVIASFTEHGQLVPVLGRRTTNDTEYDIELIYGARRLFVARLTNKPLMVELRDITDREAIVAMDIENRQRIDLSPYERGLSYARWLRGGHFQSQDELARALKVSASQVSRLLKLARLPSVIVGAFDSALDICEGWGLELVDMIDDPQKRKPAIQAARAISSAVPRPPAREVYRQLVSTAVRGRKPKPTTHDTVIRGDSGTPLFRVRHRRNSIVLILPSERVSAACLETIQQAVADVLDDSVVSERRALPGDVSRRAESRVGYA